MILLNQFQTYDYGSSDKNRLYYNQTTPDDIAFISDKIHNLVYEKYNTDDSHLDFVWVTTTNKVIYQDLMNLTQKYHPSR
jgi:hypothetical protein